MCKGVGQTACYSDVIETDLLYVQNVAFRHLAVSYDVIIVV